MNKMYADFLIFRDSWGNKEICDLTTGSIVHVKSNEFFSFGFNVEVVKLGDAENSFYRFGFAVGAEHIEFFFVRKV